jgi:wyosine [tRNA(Phe)-imidazoG37] synthetase (radical SAM superfamily)
MIRYQYLFGPVNSRRLGMSLGVDLVPYKYCPLNCVYCEVQHTTHLVHQRSMFFPVMSILNELDRFLRNEPHLDYITFSGAGEPTLYEGLGQIVEHVTRRYPQYKLALLTNGMLLGDPTVRAEVLPCHLVLPSLDAASQDVFERINRPYAGAKIEDLIQALIAFRREYSGQIWLEVFIIEGVNDDQEELERLAEAIGKVCPDRVQINSLDRPGTEEWVRAACAETLERVQRLMNARLSMPVEIIAKAAGNTAAADIDRDIESALRELLIRRPCTAEDISVSLGMHINEISKVLRELTARGSVVAKREARGVFYTWKQ